MTTIETQACVTPDHVLSLTVQLPEEVPPGEHRVVVTIDGKLAKEPQAKSRIPWPVHKAGLVPPDATLRREDIYGNDGR
jgi:hypothetical protein